MLGILTRADLLKALARQSGHEVVAHVMRRDFALADASDMLETAFQRLQGLQTLTMPVMRRGALVGLLTMENLGEFISVQTMLGLRRPAVPRVTGSVR